MTETGKKLTASSSDRETNTQGGAKMAISSLLLRVLCSLVGFSFIVSPRLDSKVNPNTTTHQMPTEKVPFLTQAAGKSAPHGAVGAGHPTEYFLLPSRAAVATTAR